MMNKYIRLNKKHSKRQQGFTLIEVMVALFIVATAISALMLKMMSLVDDTVYLDQKTIAHWVALNQIELQRISNKNSNKVLSEQKSGQEEMANRTWYWQIKPVKTANEGFIQMQVSVSDEPNSNQPLVTVMAMADIYHRR
ncbi:type II secretion system minor pseudopilin GspI [Dasania sp. GY-MA-18]|uniref:Type II secretion system protein I n=1 Tax=Dasania phycosphaerae TaxID=2950436 RepID=A0A9J6RMY8_9GAMM|nr:MULTISPECIES: type II secretion system minor pseudopilin GspI [Dasania]MCR8923241.1 type II secretion system minor pseudopilin GspI [Dasania sp. GY-MA-18]MCZ0865673.1 type II secretion system minor pseudopilin GspI [Dasania phycosphaerae]MCZ0869398.1 type II secretion system minor pseudopilin GspI [Dasania phycosphaerae]